MTLSGSMSRLCRPAFIMPNLQDALRALGSNDFKLTGDKNSYSRASNHVSRTKRNDNARLGDIGSKVGTFAVASSPQSDIECRATSAAQMTARRTFRGLAVAVRAVLSRPETRLAAASGSSDIAPSGANMKRTCVRSTNDQCKRAPARQGSRVQHYIAQEPVTAEQ